MSCSRLLNRQHSGFGDKAIVKKAEKSDIFKLLSIARKIRSELVFCH